MFGLIFFFELLEKFFYKYKKGIIFIEIKKFILIVIIFKFLVIID